MNKKISNALQYTVGLGKPEYRTNPVTGEKWSFNELAHKAKTTQQQYRVMYAQYCQGDVRKLTLAA